MPHRSLFHQSLRNINSDFLCLGIWDSFKAYGNIFVWLYFIVRPSDFCILFKVRRHATGCISHDIVKGLCSKQQMKLFYNIYPKYGKTNLISQWDRNRVLPNASIQLYHCTRALTLQTIIFIELILEWGRSSLSRGQCQHFCLEGTKRRGFLVVHWTMSHR